MADELSWLRKVPYLAGLPNEVLAEVGRLAIRRSYDRGEVIFLEGERCDGLYVVDSGRVKVFKTSPEGREQVLTLAGPGNSFNDVPVFDGGPNPASAEALEAVEVLVLPREDLQALIRKYPQVAAVVIRILAARLRHLAALVEDLSFKHVTGRVAKVLLSQSDQGARLTQQEMASMAGTAREVVARVLKSLEQEGIIEVERGRISIRDRRRLESLS